MSQVFGEAGVMEPVTVIEAGPCTVLQKKTIDKDSYCGIQLGFAEKPQRLAKKPELGHLKAAKATPKRFVREIRMDEGAMGEIEVGAQITASIFEKGERINVTGTSKGKGFQGVMKKWGFKGSQTMSHGTHENFRHAGSIGTSATPGRLFKGKKMPSRMGNERVTAKNVQIVEIRPEENLIFVRGSIPGPQNGYVIVTKTG